MAGNFDINYKRLKKMYGESFVKQIELRNKTFYSLLDICETSQVEQFFTTYLEPSKNVFGACTKDDIRVAVSYITLEATAFLKNNGIEANLPSNKPSFKEQISATEQQVENIKVVDLSEHTLGLKREPIEPNSPAEILHNVGYALYHCTTAEEVLRFKQYYIKGTAICTFNDPERRLQDNHIFFIIKYGAETMEPDPNNRTVGSEYSQSVCSIQFNKASGKLEKITSRFNHTAEDEAVNRCDETFGCNLDNINIGLSDCFYKYYEESLQLGGTGINHKDLLRAGFIKIDKKIYQISTKSENDIWYCSNNIIFDQKTSGALGEDEIKEYKKNGIIITENGAFHFDKGRYEVVEGYIIDKKNKTIELYDKTKVDGFPESIGPAVKEGVFSFKKIDVVEDFDEKGNIIGRKFKIIPEEGEEITLGVNKSNQLVSYINPNVKELSAGCCKYCAHLQTLDLPNVEVLHEHCFKDARSLINLNIPNVLNIHSGCFEDARSLPMLDLQKVLSIGVKCFNNANNLKSIQMPKVVDISRKSFSYVYNLTDLNIQNIEHLGDDCFQEVNCLKQVTMERVETIGKAVFNTAPLLENVSMPKVQTLGMDSFAGVHSLKNLYLNAHSIGRNCFCEAPNLEKLSAPNLEKIETYCFYWAPLLKSVDIPNASIISNKCFSNSYNVEYVNLQNEISICPGCFGIGTVNAGAFANFIMQGGKGVWDVSMAFDPQNEYINTTWNPEEKIS